MFINAALCFVIVFVRQYNINHILAVYYTSLHSVSYSYIMTTGVLETCDIALLHFSVFIYLSWHLFYSSIHSFILFINKSKHKHYGNNPNKK